jgi:hypothetical protein
MLWHVVDHLAPTRMNNPEPNMRPGEPCHCGNGCSAVSIMGGRSQKLNRGAQYDSQLAIAMLKSNLLDLLRIDESFEVDNLWVFAFRLRPPARRKAAAPSAQIALPRTVSRVLSTK